MRPVIRLALASIVFAGTGLMTAAPSQSQSANLAAPSTVAPPSAAAPVSAALVQPKPAAENSALSPDDASAPTQPKPSQKTVTAAAKPATDGDQSGSLAAPLQGAPIPPAQLEAFVDGVVAEAAPRDHLAGVAVAVVQNGRVVLKKGYGFAGPGRAVDPDATLFRLGSIGSTFTWIALMKEAEAGRIRLDAPANLFLPEKLQIRDQGFHRPILVRDLMSHSAGFEDRTLGQKFEEDPGQIRPLFEYLRQERPRRVREPGDLPSFSNYGVALAGAATSYVNTHPYQDLIETEILRPLGLNHTSVREPYPPRDDLPAPMAADLAANLSTGYSWRGGEFQPEGFEYATQLAPAEAGSSTAADMARYMNLILAGGQLDGVQIYDPATAAGFRTTQLAAAPGLNGWDHGFEEFTLPGGYHGQGQVGDTLWFHSSLVTVPALDLGVFVATNTDTGARLTNDLPGQIVGRFYASPQLEPRPGAIALSNDADGYAGVYLTTRRPYGGLGKFVAMLTGQMRVRVTSDGRLLTQGAGQNQTWTAAGPQGRLQAVFGPGLSAFAMTNGDAVRWFAPSGAEAFDRIGAPMQLPALIALAVLTGLASVATVLGQFSRSTREYRQTAAQSRASGLQTASAVLWLIVLTAFGLWLVQARNPARLMYHWPGGGLLIASACALVAAALTALTVLMAPLVWRGGRRLDSWTAGRKLGFTFTTLVFAAFSVVLGLWGALEPWSR